MSVTEEGIHSHCEDTNMGGKACCGLPLMILRVYSVLSTVVNIGLGIFLHQCMGSVVRPHVVASQAGDCSNIGTQISETNVDLLNLDISTKHLSV